MCHYPDVLSQPRCHPSSAAPPLKRIIVLSPRSRWPNHPASLCPFRLQSLTQSSMAPQSTHFSMRQTSSNYMSAWQLLPKGDFDGYKCRSRLASKGFKQRLSALDLACQLLQRVLSERLQVGIAVMLPFFSAIFCVSYRQILLGQNHTKASNIGVHFLLSRLQS